MFLCTSISIDWQAVGTFVALAGVIVSFLLTLRGQQQEAKLARASAERSEAAARVSEGYTQRVVDALEQMARRDPAAPLDLTVGRVRWRLDWHGGDTYILENIGTAPAEGITVTSDPTLHLIFTTDPPERIGPGEAWTFMASASLGTRDMTITVEWTTEGDDTRQEWRYPLPLRPR